MYPSKGDVMDSHGGLREAILAPLVVVTVGAVAVGVAFVLDQTPAYELSLTIGAHALLILIIGLIWLAWMLIWYFVRGRFERRRGGAGPNRDGR